MADAMIESREGDIVAYEDVRTDRKCRFCVYARMIAASSPVYLRMEFHTTKRHVRIQPYCRWCRTRVGWIDSTRTSYGHWLTLIDAYIRAVTGPRSGPAEMRTQPPEQDHKGTLVYALNTFDKFCELRARIERDKGLI